MSATHEAPFVFPDHRAHLSLTVTYGKYLFGFMMPRGSKSCFTYAAEYHLRRSLGIRGGASSGRGSYLRHGRDDAGAVRELHVAALAAAHPVLRRHGALFATTHSKTHGSNSASTLRQLLSKPAHTW